MAAVDILMPTYNAAPWLDDFMHSLLRQDFHDWRLIVRDDGSSDDTPARLAEWQAKIGDRMTVLADARGNVGVSEGTTILLLHSEAQLVMLADPDDIWLEGRISRMISEMRQTQVSDNSSAPIIISSDAIVVDANLRHMHSSFWKSVWMSPSRQPGAIRTAVENSGLACTMILNRPALEMAVPIPKSIRTQDWWLALVAASFGTFRSIKEPTILYRWHGKNLSGTPVTTLLGTALFTAVAKTFEMRARLRSECEYTALVAQEFVKRFDERLAHREAAAIRALAQLPKQGGIAARLSIARHGLWHSTFWRNLRLFALF